MVTQPKQLSRMLCKLRRITLCGGTEPMGSLGNGGSSETEQENVETIQNLLLDV